MHNGRGRQSLLHCKTFTSHLLLHPPKSDCPCEVAYCFQDPIARIRIQKCCKNLHTIYLNESSLEYSLIMTKVQVSPLRNLGHHLSPDLDQK